MECRVGDLLDVDIGRRELIDQLLAPASRREIAGFEKRAQRLEMRREDRFAPSSGHEREQCRDNENSIAASGLYQWRKSVGLGAAVRAALARAPIGASRTL